MCSQVTDTPAAALLRKMATRHLLPGDGDTSGPRITFNQVPEPKTVKNRLHLDVISYTFAAETVPSSRNSPRS